MVKIKLQKFETLIDELNQIRSSFEQNKIALAEKPLQQFESLVTDLKVLKRNVLPYRKKQTREIIKTNKHKLKLSSFELMEHNFRENTHSNILEYLFDYSLFEKGAEILSAFIGSINGIEEGERKIICEKIAKKNYSVEREKSVGSGRMDIFIYDNEFALVIENKIYSDVAKKGEENEMGESLTQLHIYENFVNRNYSSCEKVFLLLSYKQIEKDHKPFIYVTYQQLFDELEKFPASATFYFHSY